MSQCKERRRSKRDEGNKLHSDSTYKNYEKLINALEKSREETTEEYKTALRVSQEIHQTLNAARHRPPLGETRQAQSIGNFFPPTTTNPIMSPMPASVLANGLATRLMQPVLQTQNSLPQIQVSEVHGGDAVVRRTDNTVAASSPTHVPIKRQNSGKSRQSAHPYAPRDSRSVSPQIHKPIAKSNSVSSGLIAHSHTDLARGNSLVKNTSNTLSPYSVQQRRASTSMPGMPHSPHQLSVNSTGSCTSSQLSITNSTHGVDAWSAIRTQEHYSSSSSIAADVSGYAPQIDQLSQMSPLSAASPGTGGAEYMSSPGYNPCSYEHPTTLQQQRSCPPLEANDNAFDTTMDADRKIETILLNMSVQSESNANSPAAQRHEELSPQDAVLSPTEHRRSLFANSRSDTDRTMKPALMRDDTLTLDDANSPLDLSTGN